ncbi:hypothetical protein EST38_g14647, partial [Candolleomyces aberdarensis]
LPTLAGNLLQVFDQDGWNFHDDVADKYGGVFKFQGFFGSRFIYVHDPTALQHIVLKDHHVYEHADDMLLANTLVFGQGLLSTLAPIFHDVAQDLCNAITRQIHQGKDQINMLDWLTRTALEFVARGVLGTSFDVHKQEIDHPYSVSLKNFADMVDVMHNTSVAIFESKKNSSASEEELSSQPGKGKDIMSVLLKANLAAPEQDRLPDSELLAQISTITFAAMDTTSNGLARMLYLLCEHPEVQEKLRQEIKDAQQGDGKIQYDDLMSLPYLEAVCKETLRVKAPYLDGD